MLTAYLKKIGIVWYVFLMDLATGYPYLLLQYIRHAEPRVWHEPAVLLHS